MILHIFFYLNPCKSHKKNQKNVACKTKNIKFAPDLDVRFLKNFYTHIKHEDRNRIGNNADVHATDADRKKRCSHISATYADIRADCVDIQRGLRGYPRESRGYPRDPRGYPRGLCGYPRGLRGQSTRVARISARGMRISARVAWISARVALEAHAGSADRQKGFLNNK
jgi:hypothetical protein